MTSRYERVTNLEEAQAYKDARLLFFQNRQQAMVPYHELVRWRRISVTPILREGAFVGPHTQLERVPTDISSLERDLINGELFILVEC